ncbi:hypothetical protein L0938_05695 [Paracidovorax citrulli]
MLYTLVFAYHADGRILSQSIKGRRQGRTATAQGDGGAGQVTNLGNLQDQARVDYLALGYDVAGRLRGNSCQYELQKEGSGALAHFALGKLGRRADRVWLPSKQLEAAAARATA